MKIGFACDHAAVDLKNTLLEYLKSKGYECVDYGVNDPTKRVDYPIMGRKVAEAIKAGEVDKGVLVCGTGVGISLAANKVPGIRAGVCSEPYTARMIRRAQQLPDRGHGARVVGDELGQGHRGRLLRCHLPGWPPCRPGADHQGHGSGAV